MFLTPTRHFHNFSTSFDEFVNFQIRLNFFSKFRLSQKFITDDLVTGFCESNELIGSIEGSISTHGANFKKNRSDRLRVTLGTRFDVKYVSYVTRERESTKKFRLNQNVPHTNASLP
jgi:hypothetical protein